VRTTEPSQYGSLGCNVISKYLVGKTTKSKNAMGSYNIENYIMIELVVSRFAKVKTQDTF